MSPNPLVVMAAPAPDTRYAPRELPRVGGRSEGSSFESRLNQAQATSKAGTPSKGVADSKSQKPSETKVAPSPKGEVTTPEPIATKPEGKPDDQAIAQVAAQAAQAPVPTVPVSDLSSMTVMTAAVPAPEVPVEEPAEPVAQAPVQAAVQTAVAQGVQQADPALTAAVVKAVEGHGKPESKAEAPAKPKDAEAVETEAAEPEAKPAKSPVSVKPTARQAVPSSLEGLRAEKGLMSLRDSLDGAPRTETSPTPAKTASRPMPAHLDEVTASVIEDAAPEAAAVKPWELSEPVRVPMEAALPKTETAAIKAEPVPVKEAITRTFMQVQKTPDRPAELRLQLNPEHLGRMEVRVHAHEGAVSAVIRVEHGAVREMVETQLAALRTSLAEQGIKIDRLEVSVSQQGPRDQQAAAGFEFGRQQEGQRDPSGQESRGQAHPSGWDAWSLDEADVPEQPEALARSGFDAQA